MKKLLSMLVALFIMGACNTAPETPAVGGSVDTPIGDNIGSEAVQAFITKFNDKKFKGRSGTGEFNGAVLSITKKGKIMDGTTESGTLYSFDNDKLVVKSESSIDATTKVTVYQGMMMKDKDLYGAGLKEMFMGSGAPTADQMTKTYALNNINWETKTDYTGAETHKNAFIMGKAQ